MNSIFCRLACFRLDDTPEPELQQGDLMNVLLIGAGGREHALAWALSASPLLSKLVCAPGNAGIAEVAECVRLDPANAKMLYALVKQYGMQNTDVILLRG